MTRLVVLRTTSTTPVDVPQAYGKIIYARPAQIEVYPQVACTTCNGPMRTCLPCQRAGRFPLRCAGTCVHACAELAVLRTTMPTTLGPLPVVLGRYDPANGRPNAMEQLKRAAGRCVRCGWTRPEGATVVRWGRCQRHYEAARLAQQRYERKRRGNHDPIDQ